VCIRCVCHTHARSARRYLRALFTAAPRRPFPPPDVKDFPYSAVKSTALLFLLSATLGYQTFSHLPLLPPFLGAVLYGVFVVGCTNSQSKVGDLARVAGMRVSEFVNTAVMLEKDVFIVRKATTVGGVVVGRVLIFDRRHRIRDGVGGLLDGLFKKVLGGEEEEEETNNGLGGGLF